MVKRKFGDIPLIEKNLFEAVSKEKKRAGFVYAGVEFLTETELGDDAIFREKPKQTKKDIKEKYLEGKNVKEVELVPDAGNENAVWVFIKYKK